jgi:hypothetical protein
MADRHDPSCIYCEHGPYCMACPFPGSANGPVCDDCHARIVTAEIQADPYYEGDYLTMFGDDE